jgi:acyl-[acyl-carrier-protein]-phospholipid O-acyltransferase/long-chain-fatty-acid--[acyl-carrier-protein] ligase
VDVHRDITNGHLLRQVRQLSQLNMSVDKKLSWNLCQEFVHECRAQSKKIRIADSAGVKLTGSELLMRTLVLRRVLRRMLSPSERNVGVLVPPTVPGAVANFALALDGVTAVNLNYTATSAILNRCLEKANIKHVVTSRKAMEKFSLDLKTEFIYLEDVREKVTWFDKLAAAIQAKFASVGSICKTRSGRQRSKDDILTIIFTSGSTGDPKGVLLTYENIRANVSSIYTALSLTDKDFLIGVLPFFHSFGYTVTLWTPLVLPLGAAYHFSPLDARQIGKLAQDYQATVLLATPTFLRNYLRRVEPEMFKTLNLIVVGAEKQPQSLSDAFEEKFGVRPVEGYGMTEMGPLVSVNIPDERNFNKDRQSRRREGSVGRPLPDVQAKIVSLDDPSEILPPNNDGMLYVCGPGLMPEYLDSPELTNKAIKDRWYETGDIGHIDDNGFIHLTGRQSRFSKIGGEMIPHGVIEESIHSFVGETNEDGSVSAVVTAVPDEKRGERLVVLYQELNKSVDEILKHLSQSGLPNLYLPAKDDFIQVENIPVLGTGKLDLKAIRDLAVAKSGAS